MANKKNTADALNRCHTVKFFRELAFKSAKAPKIIAAVK
jgi:hypothetical protein